MRFALSALPAVLLAVTLHAQGRPLSDDQVASAILAGEMKKFDHLISTCVATAGFGEGVAANIAGGLQRDGSYDVTVSGSAGRVAFMAAEARRLYKKFNLASVTEELREPAIVVAVIPQQPATTKEKISVAAPIEHVVLKSKINLEATQPERVDLEPVEWSNLMGGKVAGNRAVASFDFNTVRQLPGDIDVVVITPLGERRCKIGSKDRLKLFGGGQ